MNKEIIKGLISALEDVLEGRYTILIKPKVDAEWRDNLSDKRDEALKDKNITISIEGKEIKSIAELNKGFDKLEGSSLKDNIQLNKTEDKQK